jgi:hypothetical protein
MKRCRLTGKSAAGCVATSILLGIYAGAFVVLAVCTAVIRLHGQVRTRYLAWRGTRQIQRWLAEASREAEATK